jgi:hypothetical protein
VVCSPKPKKGYRHGGYVQAQMKNKGGDECLVIADKRGVAKAAEKLGDGEKERSEIKTKDVWDGSHWIWLIIMFVQVYTHTYICIHEFF